MKNLYLDCEWFPNQKIFLIGYAFSLNEFGQLYDSTLSKQNFLKLLQQTDGFIYFYGPDIAMIEKNFNINIRDEYLCVNLLPIFRLCMPHASSYRLCELEKYFKLSRSSAQYKKDIRTLIRDWYNPRKKKEALRYNQEDVINLIRLKRKIFTHAQVDNTLIYGHLFSK